MQRSKSIQAIEVLLDQIIQGNVSASNKLFDRTLNNNLTQDEAKTIIARLDAEIAKQNYIPYVTCSIYNFRASMRSYQQRDSIDWLDIRALGNNSDVAFELDLLSRPENLSLFDKAIERISAAVRRDHQKLARGLIIQLFKSGFISDDIILCFKSRKMDLLAHFYSLPEEEVGDALKKLERYGLIEVPDEQRKQLVTTLALSPIESTTAPLVPFFERRDIAKTSKQPAVAPMVIPLPATATYSSPFLFTQEMRGLPSVADLPPPYQKKDEEKLIPVYKPCAFLGVS
jgi:hypothetical protein